MANTKVSALAAASALGGTEGLLGVQSGADVQVTPAQINTYVEANFAASAPIKLKSYVVSGLPSAATSGAGSMAFVTDATTTAITGLGLTVVGGGSNKVPVYSDGTNWLVL